MPDEGQATITRGRQALDKKIRPSKFVVERQPRKSTTNKDTRVLK